MKASLSVIAVAVLIFAAPIALQAQHFGLSMGISAPQSGGRASGGGSLGGNVPAANAPQMPPLPRPLPTPSATTLPSLELKLKPLNLVSTHLAPPQISVAPNLRPAALPALPFALDPIAARNGSQMCVDPR